MRTLDHGQVYLKLNTVKAWLLHTSKAPEEWAGNMHTRRMQGLSQDPAEFMSAAVLVSASEFRMLPPSLRVVLIILC